MEVGHIVRRLLQVTGDVAGEKNGVVLVLDEGEKLVQQLVADHRVQPGGGLVQDEEPGVVGQGGGDGELHLHALGEFLDLLVPGQLEPVQIGVKEGGVPVPVGPSQNFSHLGRLQWVVEGDLVQHDADILPKIAALRHLAAQHLHRAAVPVNESQNGLDGGGLAGAVLPDESQDGAAGQGQIHVVQAKVAVAFAQAPYFDEIGHITRLHIECSAPR